MATVQTKVDEPPRALPPTLFSNIPIAKLSKLQMLHRESVAQPAATQYAEAAKGLLSDPFIQDLEETQDNFLLVHKAKPYRKEEASAVYTSRSLTFLEENLEEFSREETAVHVNNLRSSDVFELSRTAEEQANVASSTVQILPKFEYEHSVDFDQPSLPTPLHQVDYLKDPTPS